MTADPGNKEKLGQKEIFTEVKVSDGWGGATACLLVKISPSGGRSLLRSLSLKRCHIKGMWSAAGLHAGQPLLGDTKGGLYRGWGAGSCAEGSRRNFAPSAVPVGGGFISAASIRFPSSP